MEERIDIRLLFYSNLVCQLFEYSSVGSELPFFGNESAPYLDDGVVKEIVISVTDKLILLYVIYTPVIKK